VFTASAAPHFPHTGFSRRAAPSLTRFFAPQLEQVTTDIVLILPSSSSLKLEKAKEKRSVKAVAALFDSDF
jgi:hypothetical protein